MKWKQPTIYDENLTFYASDSTVTSNTKIDVKKVMDYWDTLTEKELAFQGTQEEIEALAPLERSLFKEFEMNDSIKKPKHYNSGKIEVIDFIEDQKFGFHLANVVKYVARAGKKDPSKEIEDLLKAQWYLSRYIESKTKETALNNLLSKTPEELQQEAQRLACDDYLHRVGDTWPVGLVSPKTKLHVNVPSDTEEANKAREDLEKYKENK